MKSVVHVSYTGWLILPYSALARTHDFKNFLSSILVFWCKTFIVLWYNTSYRCLCVQSSMSLPLHQFSYHRLSVFICLQAPVSFSSCFWTSFSAAPLCIASHTLLLNINANLDKLPSLPRDTVFSTSRLLDSSVGTTICLPSDPK